ncbi:hypothetical protein VKT23_014012 [Stygiomarasmius scandens]|uniref:Uncharacterized protein n=1 Tax=Marasmiellus scandens TaxID=2682957 RepID=A0ABR1J1R0_9AGAR
MRSRTSPGTSPLPVLGKHARSPSPTSSEHETASASQRKQPPREAKRQRVPPSMVQKPTRKQRLGGKNAFRSRARAIEQSSVANAEDPEVLHDVDMAEAIPIDTNPLSVPPTLVCLEKDAVMPLGGDFDSNLGVNHTSPTPPTTNDPVCAGTQGSSSTISLSQGSSDAVMQQRDSSDVSIHSSQSPSFLLQGITSPSASPALEVPINTPTDPDAILPTNPAFSSAEDRRVSLPPSMSGLSMAALMPPEPATDSCRDLLSVSSSNDSSLSPQQSRSTTSRGSPIHSSTSVADQKLVLRQPSGDTVLSSSRRFSRKASTVLESSTDILDDDDSEDDIGVSVNGSEQTRSSYTSVVSDDLESSVVTGHPTGLSICSRLSGSSMQHEEASHGGSEDYESEVERMSCDSDDASEEANHAGLGDHQSEAEGMSCDSDDASEEASHGELEVKRMSCDSDDTSEEALHGGLQDYEPVVGGSCDSDDASECGSSDAGSLDYESDVSTTGTSRSSSQSNPLESALSRNSSPLSNTTRASYDSLLSLESSQHGSGPISHSVSQGTTLSRSTSFSSTRTAPRSSYSYESMLSLSNISGSASTESISVDSVHSSSSKSQMSVVTVLSASESKTMSANTSPCSSTNFLSSDLSFSADSSLSVESQSKGFVSRAHSLTSASSVSVLSQTSLLSYQTNSMSIASASSDSSLHTQSMHSQYSETEGQSVDGCDQYSLSDSTGPYSRRSSFSIYDDGNATHEYRHSASPDIWSQRSATPEYLSVVSDNSEIESESKHYRSLYSDDEYPSAAPKSTSKHNRSLYSDNEDEDLTPKQKRRSGKTAAGSTPTNKSNRVHFYSSSESGQEEEEVPLTEGSTPRHNCGSSSGQERMGSQAGSRESDDFKLEDFLDPKQLNPAMAKLLANLIKNRDQALRKADMAKIIAIYLSSQKESSNRDSEDDEKPKTWRATTPRDVEDVELASQVRSFMHDLLLDEDGKPRCATDAELDRFDNDRRAGPTAKNFSLELDSNKLLSSSWNQAAIEVFVSAFLENETDQKFKSQEVKAQVKSHMRHIHRAYRQRKDSPDEKHEKDKSFRAINRRRDLLTRRRDVVRNLKRGNPAGMENVEAAFDYLGHDAMSGDETDNARARGQGPRKANNKRHVRRAITVLEWRSQELGDLLHQLDACHLASRHEGEGRYGRGAFPDERFPSLRKERYLFSAPQGLPVNFYDAAWLRKMDDEDKQKLSIKPRAELTLPNRVTRLAKRFTHVTARGMHPLPNDHPSLPPIE